MIFDREKIESYLLNNLDGHRIACRYFPNSFKKYQIEHPTPAKIFAEETEICCDCCGKNMLLESYRGNFVVLKDVDANKYEEMYFSCSKECDCMLRDSYKKKGLYDNGWESIDELCNPTIWIMKLMGFVNNIHQGIIMSDSFFEKMKCTFINTYPYVARHLTQKEDERVKALFMYGLM